MTPTPDSTLADPEQRIADLERRLAECQAERDERTAERDEALQRETATAEVLQVINSSPGDLKPVFDAILEKALRLCDAAFGMLATYNGDAFESVALRNVPAAYAAFLQGLHRPSAETAHGRIVRGESIVQIADVAAEELYRRGDPHRRALVETAKARTLLLVPLRRDGALLGVISAYRQDVRPFSER